MAQKTYFLEKKLPKVLSIQKLLVPLHSQISREAFAQMAESVDALVSNTSGAIHPGSIPGLGTKSCKLKNLWLFFFDIPPYTLNENIECILFRQEKIVVTVLFYNNDDFIGFIILKKTYLIILCYFRVLLSHPCIPEDGMTVGV